MESCFQEHPFPKWMWPYMHEKVMWEKKIILMITATFWTACRKVFDSAN